MNNSLIATLSASDEKKLGVVISGRVHPGETNASWLMKGLVDFLTSNTHVAEVCENFFSFRKKKINK